jgi:hypothetical protein
VSADQGGFEYGRGDEPDDDARFADLPRVRVRVPDDARDLAADVRAYHRELRRRADEQGPPPPGGPSPSEVTRSGRMVVGVLALLLIVAGLAMMVSPRRGVPARIPLASAGSAAAEPGNPGGFLPDVIVLADGLQHALRDLRPAVVALVPPDCGCDQEIASVFTEAGQYNLRVLLSPVVTQPSPTQPGDPADPYTELARIAKAFGPNRGAVVQDPAGALVEAFAPHGLTLVLVAADGIVAEVRRAPTALSGLNLGLARLSHDSEAPRTTEPAGTESDPAPDLEPEPDPDTARDAART